MIQLNAYWKGVLFSLVGAVVIPVLNLLYTQIGSNGFNVDWKTIILLGATSFVGFLITFLTGLIHYPDGTTVHVTPQVDITPK